MVIEQLDEAELGSIRPLLLELLESEQVRSGEPQVTRQALDIWLPQTRGSFQGQNHVFAAREASRVVGFCWCVVFDPGTGLEGEVAELYVSPESRGQGIAGDLVKVAVELFRSLRVTFACVWTRSDNDPAMRAYQRGGFAPTEQTVLTWYP